MVGKEEQAGNERDAETEPQEGLKLQWAPEQLHSTHPEEFLPPGTVVGKI